MAQGGEGPFIALYDSTDGTPVFGEIWGPRDATNKLKKYTFGFQILGILDSINFLVLVQRAPMLRFRGTAAADIASHAAGQALIYFRTSSTVYNSEVNTPASVVYNGTDRTVTMSAFVECVWDSFVAAGVYSEGWIIIGADC
jgi:hypothetical protein